MGIPAVRFAKQSAELRAFAIEPASNLRKEITALVDQWVEENSSAMLARWLMENRERETTVAETPEPAPQQATAPPTASDNFLRDFPAERSNHHGRT